MEPRLILVLIAVVLAVAALGVFLYFFLVPRRQDNFRNLMQTGRGADLGKPSDIRRRIEEDETGEELERLKQEARQATKKASQLTLDERFFQAGVFSPEEKQDFFRMRIIVPIITAPICAFVGSYVGSSFILLGGILGVLVGLQLPFTILDRKIKNRSEEIMFYLPLVIEQIAIGVSSSLDVGPCVARVITMADERDSHNVVTELLRHAQFHVKSGATLEESLTEIGVRSGHTELKHAFMSLAQVAKHGGEITRQLQELADAVGNQRETKIEAKIKKLELEATAPVALVFMGFLVILLIGFGVQIQGAFG